MNATVDPDLVKLVQEHVNLLKKDVHKIAFEREQEEENRKKIDNALVNRLDEMDEGVSTVEIEFRSELSSTSVKVEEIQTQQEILRQRFEEQLSDSCSPEISYGKFLIFCNFVFGAIFTCNANFRY